MNREEREKQTAQDFKETFATPEGVRVLKRLAVLCHADTPCYVDQNINATAYHEGKRCVYLHIMSQINKEFK